MTKKGHAMTQAVIGKWGKNLAVRFPADIASAVGFGDGERVEVLPRKDGVFIRKLPPDLTLADMFAGKSPEEWRALYAGLEDWGPDVGREVIEP